mgnify:CR=1 FL=1|jgi:DNA-binding ferritin-like protein (Dps family)
MANIFKKLVGEKKQYRKVKKEMKELPKPYAETLEALEKYMWNFAKTSKFMDVLEELLQIFQENAAEGVPVGNVIGDDPVTFADTIMAQYPDELWLITYQNHLRSQVKKVLSE